MSVSASVLVRPAPVMLVAAMAPSIFAAVMGDIDIIVPLVLHEIDGPVAGVVLAAVLAPFLLVPGGHMEVYRLMGPMYGNGPGQDRLGVNQLGPGNSPDINLAVKAGLAYAYGYIDVGSCVH
jgi:hypothetical protein